MAPLACYFVSFLLPCCITPRSNLAQISLIPSCSHHLVFIIDITPFSMSTELSTVLYGDFLFRLGRENILAKTTPSPVLCSPKWISRLIILYPVTPATPSYHSEFTQYWYNSPFFDSRDIHLRSCGSSDKKGKCQFSNRKHSPSSFREENRSLKHPRVFAINWCPSHACQELIKIPEFLKNWRKKKFDSCINLSASWCKQVKYIACWVGRRRCTLLSPTLRVRLAR